MWGNGVCGESVSPPAPVHPGMMSMNVDYFYRHPTYTYFTYYDYLVVVDFEATCDDTRNDNPRPIRHERPEIIQFPAVLINVRTMEVEANDGIFDTIVKPVEAPILTPFCTKLTGITQSKVNKAPTFPYVLQKFERWLKSHGIALSNTDYGHSFAIVTDGSYDMGHFLYKQCIISQIKYPQYAQRWVNIGTIFHEIERRRWRCLRKEMDYLGLPFEGRAHNGLDDAKNICKVLLRYMRSGYVIHQTEKILLQAEDQERNEARILSDKFAGKYDLATVAPIVTKEYEHILYYVTDRWSTHRTISPDMVQEYCMEACYDSSESVMMNTSDYCASPSPHQQQQATSSGSCESIASGCSNKENSIPIYIPTPSTSPTSSLKSRPAQHGATEVVTVSAAGVGTGPKTSSSGLVITSGRHGGRRKKRNAQLKDLSNGEPSGDSGSCIQRNDDDGVVAKVASECDASNSDISHLHLQSKKALDSDGSATQHLQPLVSDLRTEE